MLLGRTNSVLVEPISHGADHVWRRWLAGCEQPGGLRGGAHAIDGELVQSDLGRGIRPVEVVGRPRRVDHHVVDQDHPLAPMVEGRQLSDDSQDGIRLSEVVRWDVRQVLDLSDDVVPEVADQAAVQRRQLRQVGRVHRGQDRLQGGQHPLRSGDSSRTQGVEVEITTGVDLRAVRHDGGQWVSTDEGVPPPALSSLDGLEQEPAGVPKAYDLHERGHRGDGVGHDLSPHGHDAVVKRQPAKPLGARPGGLGHEGEGSPALATPSPNAR